MANLLKLKKVTAYTAMTADASECWNAIKLLKDNNIPVHHLNWSDDSSLEGLYQALGTWNYFDGTSLYHRTFDKLPIVHWESVYDDDTTATHVAVGLEDLQNSQLLSNLDKLVRPV